MGKFSNKLHYCSLWKLLNYIESSLNMRKLKKYRMNVDILPDVRSWNATRIKSCLRKMFLAGNTFWNFLSVEDLLDDKNNHGE